MRRRAMGSTAIWTGPRKRRGPRLVATVGALLLAVAAGSVAPRAVSADDCGTSATIERVSVGINGAQSNGRSEIPTTNADGCVVGFKSAASNLIANDGNDHIDVFVRDRKAGVTERVPPLPATGSDPNDGSFPPALDGDGGIVAFGSAATNLVLLPGDFNHSPDLFAYNRALGVTEVLTLVLDQNGEGRGGGGVKDLACTISPDGNLVVFTSSADDLVSNDANETNDVFVVGRNTGVIELISVATVGASQERAADGPSAGGVVSDDGCIVAFYSDATLLTAGDTNGFRDVFVRDRCARTTERVSVSSTGEQANGPSQASGGLVTISADGRYVAFASDATNLVPGDNNGVTDVFIRDRAAGTTVRVEPPEGCTTGGGAALEPAGFSDAPSFSADGRFLAFVSAASNFLIGDTNGVADIYVLDRTSRLIARVLGEGDVQPNAASSAPHISSDGNWVAFQSDASNLVAGDTNNVADVFVAVNPFLSGGPIPGVTPLPTCTPTLTPTFNTPTPSPTITPTPSLTSTVSQPTATSTRTATSGGGGTPTPTSTPPPGSPTASATSATLTPTARTATPTAPTSTPTTSGGGGGGGGGCNCRIDRGSGASDSDGPVGALAFPALLLILRRRRGHR